MKKILIIFFVFSLQISNAQRQNRGMQNTNAPQSKPQKFDASKIAGIFYFEEEKSLKKIKIKNEVKEKKVLKIIKAHNNQIQKILFLNSEEINSLNTIAASLRASQNREAMLDFRNGMMKIIDPIRNEVKENQDSTNLKLKEILNEKQYNNWIKYVKKKRNELLPKKRSNRRPNANRNLNRRRR